MDDILGVLEVIVELQKTKSTNSKKNILIKNKDNELLKCILKFLFDPMITTGLSVKKIDKQVKSQPCYDIDNIIDCISYISKYNTGTDQVIANVQYFLNNQPVVLVDLFRSIITKKLKVGCKVRTINKVFGNDFIPVHEVQRAYSIAKYKLKENEWFSLSQKCNGIRGSYVDGKILSRQGHEITGLEHIIEDIRQLGLEDMFIDGELVRNNTLHIPDNENFRLTESIVVSDNTDKYEIQFIIFDIMPIEDYYEGESELTYRERLGDLVSINGLITDLELHNTKLVDILYMGTDQTKIKEYLDLMVSQGKEGLILNRDTKYKCTKNNGILKIKEFYTCDVKCIGIKEGKDDLSGTLGSIIVDYKGFPCGVGGFNKQDRDKFFNNPDLIVGKIVEVKYKEESNNKKGGKSMQFPVFVRIRYDKTEPNYD